MRPAPLLASALLALVFPAPGRTAPQSGEVAVTGLRTEHLVNPLGIDVPRPRLGWKLESPERGVSQTARQIQVSDAWPADFENALVWDSGRVESGESVHVAYDGPGLRSRTRYSWRVRVWTDGGRTTPWSAVAWWEAGLLDPGDWGANWVGGAWEEDPMGSNPPHYLRREFDLDGPITSARIYATARGVYELHLNGRRVGDRLFAPGFTSYDARLQYQTYDVTDLLVEGPNVLGAVVADGWYRGQLGFEGGRNTYGEDVGLFLQLEARSRTGAATVVATDADWVARTGPILKSDIYQGEVHDGRIELGAWSAPRYEGSGWTPVRIFDGTSAQLVADSAPPVRRIEELRPTRIFRAPNGEAVVDLGQNIVGRVRVRFSGDAGQTVRLRHGEALGPDGNLYTANLRGAGQTDLYTLGGADDETWEPAFTFHGFRYVAIEGYPGGLPSAEDVTGIVIHSDLVRTGSFATSDPHLDRLHENIVWSQRGNFLEIPTDCPQRDERLGWTGDVQVFAPTACFNMDSAAFLSRWLRDLAADQHPDGNVPWVVPDVLGDGSAGSAGWGDAAVIVPWTLYLRYGDRRILEQQYSSMEAWVSWALEQAQGGVWRTGFQFGDWLSAPDAETPAPLIATAYLAHSLDLMVRISEVLGREEEADRHRAAFRRVREAFRRAFVSFGGSLRHRTQTAWILALRFGLLTDAFRSKAVRDLAADIRARGTHLSTGFLGTPHANRVLTEAGLGSLAYDLLFQEEFPSWLYPVTQGATTVWERWDGIRGDVFQDPAMNSLNHYAPGAVGDWMYRTIGGIAPDPESPGFRRVLVAPLPDPRLDWARASLETPYGTVRVGWTQEAGRFDLDVEIPPNSSARIRLPGAPADGVLEGGLPLEESPGIGEISRDGAGTWLGAASGRYSFSYLPVPDAVRPEPPAGDPPWRGNAVLAVLALAGLLVNLRRTGSGA